MRRSRAIQPTDAPRTGRVHRGYRPDARCRPPVDRPREALDAARDGIAVADLRQQHPEFFAAEPGDGLEVARWTMPSPSASSSTAPSARVSRCARSATLAITPAEVEAEFRDPALGADDFEGSGLVFGTVRLAFGASIGGALFPDDGGDALALFDRADQAMHAGKRKRKDARSSGPADSHGRPSPGV